MGVMIVTLTILLQGETDARATGFRHMDKGKLLSQQTVLLGRRIGLAAASSASAE